MFVGAKEAFFLVDSPAETSRNSFDFLFFCFWKPNLRNFQIQYRNFENVFIGTFKESPPQSVIIRFGGIFHYNRSPILIPEHISTFGSRTPRICSTAFVVIFFLLSRSFYWRKKKRTEHWHANSSWIIHCTRDF